MEDIKKAATKTWHGVEKILEAVCTVGLGIMIIWAVWNFVLNPSMTEEFKQYQIYDRGVYTTLSAFDPESEWSIPSKRELPADAVWTGKVGIIYMGEAFTEDLRVTISITKSGDQYYVEPSRIQFMSMGLECDYNDIFTRAAVLDIYKVLLNTEETVAINFTNQLGYSDVLTVTNLENVEAIQAENQFLQEHGSSDPFT